MKIWATLIAAFVLFAFSQSLVGQTAVTDSNNANQVDPGDLISPKAKLPLRESPPGGLFGLKGQAVGVVWPDVIYRVTDEKDIQSFIGVQKWIKVRTDYDALSNKAGWIFSGYAKEPNQNVVVLAK